MTADSVRAEAVRAAAEAIAVLSFHATTTRRIAQRAVDAVEPILTAPLRAENAELRGNAMSLTSMQRKIWENKQAKGFNTTDVPLEICLLQGEVAELFDEWRKRGEGVSSEIADVAIYLLSLAQMLDVDLQTAIEDKMIVNAQRTYVRRNGVLVKSDPLMPETALRAAATVSPKDQP